MEDFRELGKQRVGDGRRRLADGHRPDLDAFRVPVGLAAQGVGQQLMAVADAEHRLAGSHHPGQPARGGLAPGGPVGHHGAGAGDDGGRDLTGIGQAMCIKTGIDDPHRCIAQRCGDPGFEASPAGGEVRNGVAKLDDEQG